MATAVVYFLDGPEARTTKEMHVSGSHIEVAQLPPIDFPHQSHRPTPVAVCKVFTYALMKIPDAFPNGYPVFQYRYIAMLKD